MHAPRQIRKLTLESFCRSVGLLLLESMLMGSVSIWVRGKSDRGVLIVDVCLVDRKMQSFVRRNDKKIRCRE